ncbi:MAG TPA: SDR family NAD(P)-dependent oxidoreductase, partial [Actinophytocola sp.]|uniref:SDR family NAD(P)-dependent oxidoreductase n=1 Tax=Actinophytocola sp. TaxID=1872138 RepID=UPI002DBD7C59
LEADLGIDTVKQAEVFALIRERFGIPREDTLKLRDYPTLGHVIGFVRERSESPTADQQAEAVEVANVAADVTEADRIPRRVPVPTIRPPVGMCAPTGVELGAGARVIVAADQGGVGAALSERLAARGVDVLSLEDGLAEGPVHGVYWLTALDHEGPLDDLAAWREANRVRVKLLYATMRRLYDTGAFLITGTRLGGRHGYDDAGAFAPLGGAVTGFAKAFARERPDTLVKAVDFGHRASAAEIAEALVEETLHDPGAVEIGHSGGLRWTITVEERPATGAGMTLDHDTVFVVTGAAGSIVSAITADLAAASGGTFHLLDLTPEPDPDDADIARFAGDKEGLKADLIQRMRAAGDRPTPVLVERELARYERLAAARAAIDAVTAAGGQAHYHSVDLTDGDAVAQALAGLDRVDVLLHAAGLDISHALSDKEPHEYDLVFDVKADGWFNLVKAIGDRPLGTTVAFSSVAGRFGNLGQTDYAAASDLLCKLASAMRTTRPDTRAIAVDWTAWAGIGMATRGSIPKVMAQAGIEMLPPEVGIPTIRGELTAGTRGELVVAGALGAMVEERDGIDPAQFPAAGPMVGTVVRFGVHSGLVVETTLDPAEQPFLYDHRIDGTPVLPGVMGIEGFVEVAALPLPGWHPVQVEDVEFLAPCKFYRDEPRTVTITAAFRPDGDELVAHCRLEAGRQLANQVEPQVTTHFTGTVRLARVPAADITAPVPNAPDGKGATADAIYGVYFHGPAFQVLERAWCDERGPVGSFAAGLPVDHVPAERPELVAPRLIELVFQTAGVWEVGHGDRFGLPRQVDRIVPHGGRDLPKGRVAARISLGDNGFDGQVIDESGAVLLELNGYRTVELPGGVDPDRRAPLTEAMS